MIGHNAQCMCTGNVGLQMFTGWQELGCVMKERSPWIECKRRHKNNRLTTQCNATCRILDGGCEERWLAKTEIRGECQDNNTIIPHHNAMQLARFRMVGGKDGHTSMPLWQNVKEKGSNTLVQQFKCNANLRWRIWSPEQYKYEVSKGQHKHRKGGNVDGQATQCRRAYLYRINNRMQGG